MIGTFLGVYWVHVVALDWLSTIYIFNFVIANLDLGFYKNLGVVMIHGN
jgi:hypothetical protein